MSPKLARRIVLRLLAGLHDGRITIIDGDERIELGPPAPLRVEVRIRDPRAWRGVLGGSLGLGDSFAAGYWECDDLVALVRIAARNVGRLDAVRRRYAPVLMTVQRAGDLARRSTPARSRRDIAAHYDLGNELFSLFLDETMSYSCALFPTPEATLEEASAAKLERICAKLDLGPEDHVLEIGTGWGGFALHAAGTRGCRVTTTTISAEQRAWALERVEAAGLSHLVTILDQDYRELRGNWSKLVSVEMIEAVGWRNLDTYLHQCGALLAPGGVMLLQAITMDDRAYDVEKGGRSFASTRIFPGGFLPSLEAIARSLRRTTELRTVHLEDLTPHYAETLHRWRERFDSQTGALQRMGYDERFRRMWRFYLSWCEAGFHERRIGDVQLMLAAPRWHGERALLERLGEVRPGAPALAAPDGSLSAG